LILGRARGGAIQFLSLARKIPARQPLGVCDHSAMPHRPPKKVKKEKSGGDSSSKESQLAEQRRREMAARSTLARFQNRSSERK
jgi:hypothetical protein